MVWWTAASAKSILLLFIQLFHRFGDLSLNGNATKIGGCWSKPGLVTRGCSVNCTRLNPTLCYVRQCSHGFGALRFHFPFFLRVLSGVFFDGCDLFSHVCFPWMQRVEGPEPFQAFCIRMYSKVGADSWTVRTAKNKKSRFSMSTEHLPVEEYRENRNLKGMMSHHVPSIHRIFTISRMIFCLWTFPTRSKNFAIRLVFGSPPGAHAFRMFDLRGRHLVDVIGIRVSWKIRS